MRGVLTTKRTPHVADGQIRRTCEYPGCKCGDKLREEALNELRGPAGVHALRLFHAELNDR